MTIIDTIRTHTYGGSGAAVVPGSSISAEKIPEGGAPAGVAEVLGHLQHMLAQSSDPMLRQWVFLVGGPGNGKSHQLSQFIDNMVSMGARKESPVSSVQGRYCDDLVLNGQRLLIVNDATIRPPNSSGHNHFGHLAADLAKALVSKSNVLVNVNRGVLIEELALSREIDPISPLSALLKWLVSDGVPLDSSALRVSPTASTYYHAATFTPSESLLSYRVHVVCMDTLSLLELVPKNGDVSVSSIETSSPVCAQYKIMDLLSDYRWQSPAGQLFKSIIAVDVFELQGCGSCPAAQLCPFLANISSLRVGPAGLGILVFFRAAEISTGRLFNYRDLWSLAATAVLGPNRTAWTSVTPCEWVCSRVQDTSSSDKTIRRRAIVELSQQRLHHTLFSGKVPSPLFCGLQSWRLHSPLHVPALDNLRFVDPAGDVTWEWAEDVHTAMEEWAFQQSPLEGLRRANRDVDSYCCSLDDLLEKELLQWLGGDKIKDAQRRDHIRWLGTSYYRLLALNKLWPGKRTLIQEWIKVRAHVDAGQTHIMNSDLHSGLQHLLFPEFRQANFELACLLPLFAARVEPIRGPQERNTLCVAVPRIGHDAVVLEYATTGDALWLCLMRSPRDGGGELARLRLDYFSCREAMVSARGYGFTEAGATSMPRVERVRASLVAASRSHYSLVLVGNMAVAASPTGGRVL
jgi:hypothetical protein